MHLVPHSFTLWDIVGRRPLRCYVFWFAITARKSKASVMQTTSGNGRDSSNLEVFPLTWCGLLRGAGTMFNIAASLISHCIKYQVMKPKLR